MDRQMGGWKDGRKEGGVSGCVGGWWTEGRREGWTDGWMVRGDLFCTGMDVGGWRSGVVWFRRVHVGAEA